jgi:two-component system phosphate regulon sensor histidine kinase PhoR
VLELSKIISTVPDLNGSLEHVARSMAYVTHSDQSAILTLDTDTHAELRPAVIYGPDQPLDRSDYENASMSLAACASLERALVDQQTTVLEPQNYGDGLASLYELWHEDRQGPTLIQPLTVHGRSIGALILGNPVSQHAIRSDDRELCRSLASQIAIIVEAYRRYVDLQMQLDAAALPEPVNAAPVVNGDSELAPSLGQALEDPVTAEPESVDPVVDEDGDLEHLLARAEAEVAWTNGQQPGPQPADPIVSAEALAQTPAASDLPEPLPVLLGEIDIDNYRSIIEAVHEGVVVSDVRGQVQLVNPAAERILRKSRQELMEQPIGAIYGEIDSGESIEKLAAAFSRRNEPLPTFIENDERAIQGHLIPWRNEDQEWLGIIAVFRDVTRQVRADAARNNFISALSRVLRGPLAIVKGYTELITNGTMDEYSAEQLQVQRIIHSSVERVVQLLDNAIQISAQNKRKIVPRFEELQVEDAVKAVVREITPLARIRELTFIQEVNSGLPPIVADSRHLHRILMNLLSNACRFTPAGGRVTLRVWIQQERRGSVARPHLQMAVIDSGIGIPQIEYNHIFDPFYQLDNPAFDQQNVEGMGMGLAVVKELVELHSGRVWVESEPGVGSTFQVSLPASQE